MKYIVVTGGVVSGLGKGVTISSIGRVLKNCGLRTTSIKIDPYLVSDALSNRALALSSPSLCVIGCNSCATIAHSTALSNVVSIPT